MKIRLSQLRQIIKEEVSKALLSEADAWTAFSEPRGAAVVFTVSNLPVDSSRADLEAAWASGDMGVKKYYARDGLGYLAMPGYRTMSNLEQAVRDGFLKSVDGHDEELARIERKSGPIGAPPKPGYPRSAVALKGSRAGKGRGGW